MATLAIEPVTFEATEATVLDAASSIYLTAPAHGVPFYDPSTGGRTHCVRSAIYAAACNLGVPHLTGPASRRMVKAAGVSSILRLEPWEAAADTDEVRAAFVRAGELAA